MFRLFSGFPGNLFTVNLPPLPVRLLRRILIGGHHEIGEHVLIAGDHCDEMARWMDELGFDVEAIDDSFERLTARQRSGVKFKIHFARLDGSDVIADEPFDLIISDELNLYRENLLCRTARLATADLLARLKPGGDFVVVQEPGHLSHHDSACWTRHLACFPGSLEAIEYPAPLFSRDTLQWLMQGLRPERFSTVSLRTPSERLPPLEWAQHVHRSVLTGFERCCEPNQIDLQQRAA